MKRGRSAVTRGEGGDFSLGGDVRDWPGVLRTPGQPTPLVGSMGRRGNPYDNAKAESFMKTLKVEAVYLMDYETFEDVTATRFTTLAFRARLSEPGPVRGRPRPEDGQN